MIDLRRKRISVGDAVKLATNLAELLHGEYVPRDILNENTLIHKQIGADNNESVELKIGDWTLVGTPDAVLDDCVVEVKVQRPLTREKELLEQAFYQAAIYADILKLQHWEVWIYVYSTGELKKYRFSMDEHGALYQEFLTKLKSALLALEIMDKKMARLEVPECYERIPLIVR